ncbi:hypothetical protein Tco_0530224 [Tanacetum coccineum]
MRLRTELTLDNKPQQGVSDEVLISIEGVNCSGGVIVTIFDEVAQRPSDDVTPQLLLGGPPYPVGSNRDLFPQIMHETSNISIGRKINLRRDGYHESMTKSWKWKPDLSKTEKHSTSSHESLTRVRSRKRKRGGRVGRIPKQEGVQDKKDVKGVGLRSLKQGRNE